VIPKFHEQARPVWQLARVDDLRSVCSSDGHGATLFSGINLYDVCPADLPLLPEPGNLLQAVVRYDYRFREREDEHYGEYPETSGNDEVQWPAVTALQLADGGVDQVHDQ